LNAEVVVFAVFAVIALAGALTMVTARNPVYSVLGLLGAMFAVAVFYVMNDAHFIAAVQVLIYAGAVMTLFLFVIMLIGVDKSDDRSEQIPFQRPIGILLTGGLLALVLLGARAAWVTGIGLGPDTGGVGTIENISRELFRAWLLPFEATTLLLTIAAVGTVAMARFGPQGRSGGHRVPDTGHRTEKDPESGVRSPESAAERSEDEG